MRLAAPPPLMPRPLHEITSRSARPKAGGYQGYWSMGPIGRTDSHELVSFLCTAALYLCVTIAVATAGASMVLAAAMLARIA